MRIMALAWLALLGCSAPVWSQDSDVPACKPGMLVPDYENKECTVGNLDFKFGATMSPFAKSTEVKPVPNGLEFSFPLPVPKTPGTLGPLMIIFDVGIPFQVKGLKTAILDTTLSGNVGALPKGLLVSGAMLLGDPAKPKDQVKLVLAAFGSVKATFSKPVPAGTPIAAKNEFNIHSGKPPGETAVADAPVTTLVWTDTFTSSAKDIQVGTADRAGTAPAEQESAQAAPCAKGSLKDYLGNTCTVGNFSFAFAKDYGGENAPDPSKVMVQPVEKPAAGLRFKFPQIKLGEFQFADVRFKATVSGVGIMLGSTGVAGDVAGGVLVSAGFLVPVKGSSPEPAFLQLNGTLINSMDGVFRTTPSMVKVDYSLALTGPLTTSPAFMSVFGPAKKDSTASEP